MTIDAAACTAALDRGETLPWSWYSDPAIAALEQERLFRRSWHYVGRTAQVAEPGQFFTCEAAGVPVVVTRDRTGTLNALVNVCRHRGAQVVHEDCGSRKTLRCFYHAWTYGLDGSLRKVPRGDREPSLDTTALGLHRASADTWGPFVFVHLDPQPAPLADTLGDLPALLADGGIDLTRMRFHSRVHYTIEANWKVAVENYLECYHCPVAHPGFSDVVDVSPDAYTLEVRPTFATHHGTVRATPRKTQYPVNGPVPAGQYHLLWPSLKANVHPGQPNLSLGPLHPTAPDRTTGYLDYFFGNDVDQDWITAMLAFDNQVGAQDTDLVESVHRGAASGAVERGRLLRNSEHTIEAFQRHVLNRLQET
ncbi:aromatic ring-hydroxylating oxygenase subunit alpha [Streptomyces formicae]|uniref:Aromatic ring-hydroxylating dioxygenase subunit alpha n=1 Tax=Streptomyces formicae TaxID=1616117 RepID=A0ABY3WRN2_9ACTN|nr:aromatic ring-hydroxylating dioxygenase subunit alpha [Streptomyces formicae]UNM13220.1 aromatic ring-hydroxylating dioxygenase subunit alpha [Streptomyces formicae]